MESKTVIASGQKLQIVEYDDKEHVQANATEYEITVGENAALEM